MTQLIINPIIFKTFSELFLLQNYIVSLTYQKIYALLCTKCPLGCTKCPAHFFPNRVFSIVLPIFRWSPAFEVGIPVSLAIFCLILVMPSARFSEKLRPGIGVEFLPILFVLTLYIIRFFRLSHNNTFPL